MKRPPRWLAVGAGAWLAAEAAAGAPAARAPSPHVPCAERDALRRAHFGALHVHTSLSFDAWTLDVRTRPDDAYRFARGGEVRLPPLSPSGLGTRALRLARPLDFAAVTDHAELLGERARCVDENDGSELCRIYRGEAKARISVPAEYAGVAPLLEWLGFMVRGDGRRDAELCGPDGSRCREAAGGPWREIQEAAERHYDRSDRCRFTTFVAYEYTATPGYSNLHRNVIFANEAVPALPTSAIEAPEPSQLWKALERDCLAAGTGCDALAIPHNSNVSNGRMFRVEYPGARNAAEQAAQAALRAKLETLVEVYQHKGDSECRTAGAALLGAPDEMCGFEKWRPPGPDCGDGGGEGGLPFRRGCESVRDSVRGALALGLREEERIGVNPFRLGIVAATDTHNGTGGAVDERSFAGHGGRGDADAESRLAAWASSPGGLAGVFAEENTREALFAAMRRRETFGTSGPRIVPRFFGGWGLPDKLCADAKLVERGYAEGVPMGGVLAARPQGAKSPAFAVAALRDPGTPDAPGGRLQRIQVVKVWADPKGGLHQAVYDAAGGPNDASVDPATCEPTGAGQDSLCAVWRDPDFDPARSAAYYARVLENPSCRWSTWQCLGLPAEKRPPSCSDPAVPKTIQDRAWTSPIWYEPRATR